MDVLLITTSKNKNVSRETIIIAIQNNKNEEKMKKIILISIILFTVFFLIGCGGGSSSSPSSNTQIAGTVRYSDSSPAGNAKVTLSKIKKSPSADYETYTDKKGYFIFENINPGYYFLKIEKDGFSVSTYAEAEKGKTVYIPEEETVLEAEKGSAEIYVIKNNVPVKNIKIFLEKNQTVLKATSDENGKALFDSVRTGIYTVKVEGYDIKEKINIAKNTTAALTLDLSDKQSEITFMFYANSYNLGEGLTDNIKQMFQYGSTDKVNIVVFYKTEYSQGVYRGLVRKTDGSDITEGLEKLNNINFGEISALRNFILWAKTNYPAENYILDLWDHGTGWTPYWDTKAINHDEDYSDYLECYEVHEAIRNTDLTAVCCDACMMNMIEFATQIKDDADILMASEANIPINGYNYSVLLKYLNEKNSIENAFSAFGKEQIKDELWANLNTDIHVSRLADIDRVNEKIKDIADFLTEHSAEYAQEITNARNHIRTIDHYSKDLKSYLEDLAGQINSREFNNLVNEYNSEVRNAMIYSGDTEYYFGYSVNIPNKTVYANRFSQNYPNTVFARATGWDKFLASQR